MNTSEWHPPTADARHAGGRSAAAVWRQEAELRQCLSATGSVSRLGTVMADPSLSAVFTTAPVEWQTAGSMLESGNLVAVGIDGSGCARHAAHWAAEEAVHRRADLRLIEAYHLPPAGSSGGNRYPPHLLADLREEGVAVLDDTAKALHRRYPDLKISRSLAYGDPATVLRHASGRAALMVVGTHGPGRMAAALGSVAASVVGTSSSPVAVIGPGVINRKGPVVVGVDGSPTARAALTYAFRAAADRHATLLAVHCWTDPNIDGLVAADPAGNVGPAGSPAEDQRRLTAELAEFVIEYPDVLVEQAVIHERPTVVLPALAASAQLVVVGGPGRRDSRPRGTSRPTLSTEIGSAPGRARQRSGRNEHGWQTRSLAGPGLGSTGRALIERCACPVVIARPAAPS